MNRQEAIQFFKQFVPSFNRKFEDEDFLGKEGWMYRNIRLPKGDIISPGYLEGTKIVRDGKEFKIISKDDNDRIFENKEMPEGRGVTFTYMNYPGNPHLYGKVEISGVEMVHYDKKRDKYISTSPSKEECKENPALQDASYTWTFEPCRIVPEEEINANPAIWDMTYANTRTCRFTDVKELIATIVVACLKIVQGPFFLIYGEYGYKYNEKNCYLKVTKDDNVILSPIINKRFKIEKDG